MTWETQQGVINLNSVSSLKLPQGFEIEKINDLRKILPFIKENYSNSDSEFRLEYTFDHLNWYFYNSLYDFIGLKYNNKIIGCISGKIDAVYLNNETKNVFEINFLCLDSRYRKKGLINYLIAEIGRLALMKNITTGLYIARDKHSKPMCKIDYYLYYSNLECANDLGLLELPYFDFLKGYYIKNLTLETCKYKALNIERNEPITEYIVNKLDDKYSQHKLGKKFDIDDIARFKNNENVITTFSLYINNVIAGFISYYHLNLLHKASCKTIKQAYILYYWYDTELIDDVTVLFKSTFNKLNVDIIITNNISELASEDLRKSIKINNKGSHCYYYIYNNSNFNLHADQIGIFIP